MNRSHAVQLSTFDATALTVRGDCEQLEALGSEVGEVDEEGLVTGKPFRIFKYGNVATEKGKFVVPSALAQEIAAAWKDRGNDMHIDYEHGLVKTPPGQPIRTAGWCSVEARTDGLYATNVKWTKEAFGLIQKREYKYISPLFGHTPEGVVTSLENVAVTVDPATHNLEKLKAASASKSGTEKPMAKKNLAKFLKTRMDEHELSPDELSKELRMTSDRLSKLASGEEKPTADELGRLSKCLHTKHEHISKLAADDEADEQHPAGKDAGTPPDGTPGKSDADPMFGRSEETASALAAKAKAEKDAKEINPNPKPSGFKVPGQLAALAAHITDPAEKGAFAGMLAALENVGALATQVATLSARLEDREKSEKQSELSRLLEQGQDEGKITPAMREFCSTLGVEGLKSFLSVAPVQGPGRRELRAPPAGRETGAGTDPKLVKSVAMLTGKTPEQTLSNYRAYQEREANKRRQQLDD